jgi:hypothetical protein
MKPKWLWVLLVVSLAGNAVELGAFIKQSWTPIRHLFGAGWGHGTSSASYWLRAVSEDGRREFDSLQEQVQRLEIEESVLEPGADAARVDSMQRTRAFLKRETMRVVFFSGRAIADVADPIRRKRLTMRWCDMMDIKGGEKQVHFDTR